MKKLLQAVAITAALLAVMPASVRAGLYYDLQQAASSAALKLAGTLKMFAVNTSGTATITLNGVDGGVTASSATFTATGGSQYSIWTSSGINAAAGTIRAAFIQATTNFYGNLIGNVTGNLTGAVTGNATTATALAANGSNCSAGNYPLGVDASGAVEGCTAAGIGDVTQAGANTFSNNNTFGTAATNVTFGSSVTFKGGVFGGPYVRVNNDIASGTSLTDQSTLVVAVSTISAFNVTNANVIACFAGSVRTAASNEAVWTILVDGIRYASFANNKGIFSASTFGTGSINMSGCRNLTGLSNGSHNFALVFAHQNSEAWTLDANFFAAAPEFSIMKFD